MGKGAPTAPADASCTRWRRPGAIDPVSAVACQVVPAAEAYWTVQPLTSTAVDPRLKSSTKSLAYAAPPPPAYTWLTTMSGEALRAAGTTSTVTATRRVKRRSVTARRM